MAVILPASTHDLEFFLCLQLYHRVSLTFGRLKKRVKDAIRRLVSLYRHQHPLTPIEIHDRLGLLFVNIEAISHHRFVIIMTAHQLGAVLIAFPLSLGDLQRIIVTGVAGRAVPATGEAADYFVVRRVKQDRTVNGDPVLGQRLLERLRLRNGPRKAVQE